MSDEPNPYQPPIVQPATEPAPPLGALGVLLPLYVLGLTVIHVSVAVVWVAVPEHVTPIRAVTHFTLAALSLFVLFQRRLAVAGFFLVNVVAIPLHLVRYGSSPTVVMIGFGALPAVLLALVWNKLKAFR
jgi:hypothetical protein